MQRELWPEEAWRLRTRKLLRDMGAAAAADIAAARKDASRLRRAIERAPCPWSACCVGPYAEPNQRGRLCWRAKALGLTRADIGG